MLDGESTFLVDGGGLVQPPGADWSLDWWIGADDRWYAPSREPSVRQRRRGPGPVLDTSMRVPSGDVVQTVYATSVDGRTVAVVEVANQSPVPVALAFAVRPFGWRGPTAGVEAPSMRWVDDEVLEIDGWRLTLPRRPNERASSASVDLFETVNAGEPLVWNDAAGNDAVGNDAVAGYGVILYPLPHGTSLRIGDRAGRPSCRHSGVGGRRQRVEGLGRGG